MKKLFLLTIGVLFILCVKGWGSPGALPVEPVQCNASPVPTCVPWPTPGPQFTPVPQFTQEPQLTAVPQFTAAVQYTPVPQFTAAIQFTPPPYYTEVPAATVQQVSFVGTQTPTATPVIPNQPVSVVIAASPGAVTITLARDFSSFDFKLITAGVATNLNLTMFLSFDNGGSFSSAATGDVLNTVKTVFQAGILSEPQPLDYFIAKTQGSNQIKFQNNGAGAVTLIGILSTTPANEIVAFNNSQNPFYNTILNWPTPIPVCNNCEHYYAVPVNQTPVVLANPTQTYGKNYNLVGLTTTNGGVTNVNLTIRANGTTVWGPQNEEANGGGAVVPYPMPVPTNAGQVDCLLDKVSTPGPGVDVILQPK